MTMTPLVSVLMPAFNSELYIAEAINSILNQTYRNIELIIFDDGSTDKTRELIESYQDPRIVRMFSDTNLGVVRARNEMIDRAAGQYIALMDADDIADLTRIEKQIDSLERGDCDICGSAQWVLDEAKQKIKKSKDKFTDSDLRALLAVYCGLCNSAMTGKTEIFKRFKYDTAILTSEDYYLWVQMAAAGYRFLNLKERLITYRRYPAQTSSVHLDKFRVTTIEVQKKYLELLGISADFYPRHMPFIQRMKYGIGLLRELNSKFKSISLKANAEIYARFQYRRNRLFTPFTRLERLVVGVWATYLLH
ncbi:glycosyltransferase family 2 protein [Polynucleobacter sp. MWH-Creno-3A4]|uniref:glycosyltransferase family 2 protein n=1 Tax=Polynucleobacter sp. MWH-Creno-3A4 TaxID=1855886 RepID=UPI001C0C233F|nr:glycosyltransferase family 2 protein [Polynucleobacter sp. MWH-Creno-3A4]MBU3606069.1 glycosyltransferase family 2 protein [Polynucleobacter sp. MWH-Creno-3A4]